MVYGKKYFILRFKQEDSFLKCFPFVNYEATTSAVIPLTKIHMVHILQEETSLKMHLVYVLLFQVK